MVPGPAWQTMRWSDGGSPARALLTIAIGFLVIAGPLAQAQNETHSTPPPEPGEIWTVETHVDATVVDNYATVNITVVISNEGPDPEFPFEVQVPDDAYITGLTIERDGQVHQAQIEEREAARQTYEQAKDDKRTAGLVEKHRTSSVYSYLINVEAFETVTATLTYEHYLAADKGVHTLPLAAPVSGFGRDLGAGFDVDIQHSDGVTSAWSEPRSRVSNPADGYQLDHEVGPRETDASTPLDVHYTVAPTDGDGSVVSTVHNGTGYFAHRFRAPSDAADLPIDLTMVLDTSGSMSGLKIDQLKDAARQVVGSLDTGDRFNLVSFSSGVQQPWEGLQPADADRRSEAMEAVDRLLAAGSTNMEAGIDAGFSTYAGPNATSQERLPVLVFLTDGQPTMGTTEPSDLRALARQANEAGVHVFAMAFGSDADWQLVHGLAEDGNGTAIRVPEGQGAEVDLRRFMSQLTAPVLKDVEIRYGPGIEAMNATAPILFAGSELLVVGTFDPNRTSIDATVDATSPEGAKTYEVSEPIGEEQASFLPRLVAYHQVRALQDQVDAEGASPELVEDITRLSLEHGFVTDQTSLVLTLSRHASQPEGNVTMEAEDGGDGEHAHEGGDSAAADSGASGGGGGAPAAPSSGQQHADADGDGIPDASDHCPNEAGTASSGCPASSGDTGDPDPTSKETDSDGARDAAHEPDEDDQQRPIEEPQNGTPVVSIVATLVALATLALVLARTPRDR